MTYQVSIDPLYWEERPNYVTKPDGSPRYREYGTYTIPFLNLPISPNTVRNQFKVDRHSDFIMTGAAAPQLSVGGLGYLLSGLPMQLVNDSRSRNVSINMVDALLTLGGSSTAAVPLEWAWPVTLRRGSIFSAIVINNLAGTVIQDIRFVFHGIKVFFDDDET